MRMRLHLTAALVAVLTVSCATLPPPAVAPLLLADRLFFGRSVPAGGAVSPGATVSDEEWTAFVRDVVTPRFPEGLTIWRAEGQWRERTGDVTRESTMVVEIVHEPSPEADAKLEEIAREYKTRFHQEAVMRVTSPAQMRFY